MSRSALHGHLEASEGVVPLARDAGQAAPCRLELTRLELPHARAPGGSHAPGRRRRARGGAWRPKGRARVRTGRVVQPWRPIGSTWSTLAGWPRHNVSAHRRSAQSPSVKRSFATSARAHAPPTSSRASSGSRRSRSPTTSPTSPARSGRRRSGCAWGRPGVSAAASSSGSGTASTGPRPAQSAVVSTSAAAFRRRAGLSPTPEFQVRCRVACARVHDRLGGLSPRPGGNAETVAAQVLTSGSEWKPGLNG